MTTAAVGEAQKLNQQGVRALEQAQPALAAELLGQSVALEPRDFAAHVNLGNALCALGRFETALASYARATALNPNIPQTYNNQGNALRELRQQAAALVSYDKALALDARYLDAHLNRGVVLLDLGRPAMALGSYDAALALDARCAEAWVGRGDALSALRRYGGAIECYQRALALRPRQAAIYNKLGIALAESGQYEAAATCYGRGIALAPNNADLHNNLGNALRRARQYAAAARSYDTAYRLRPDLPGLAGVRLHTRMQLCEWEGFEADVTDLTARIGRGEYASNPLFVLALSDSGFLQKEAARSLPGSRRANNLATSELLPALAPGPAAAPVPAPVPPPSSTVPTSSVAIHRGGDPASRIRVAYFSADFHNHATSYLIAELLEIHDRSRFEILAFSYGQDAQDEMRQRIVAACDRFTDVRSQSDKEVAHLSRSLGVDIAIDLKGLTRGGRPGIFAHRAAPIQVSYLGYPGTLGAPYMDYLVADRTLIPEELQGHYTEKVIYLPDSYQVNDSKRRISALATARADHGLPDESFVFCCFNNTYKITPRVFEVWLRILHGVPHSVLWLFEGSPEAAHHLQSAAQRRGIEPQRLVFAKRLPSADHLARYRLADLFLDTLPCNAHTTASDALWAGLPVLTCMGEAFASRVAASLLRAVGLPELVTSTLFEYEQRAVSLAAPPNAGERDGYAHGSRELTEIRQRLASHRLSAPLFDTQRFRTHIETAFVTVCDRHRASLPPDHIYIGAA